MNESRKAKARERVARKVVEALCARLEKGVNPWVKPWGPKGEASSDPAAFAVNLFTRKPYGGINQAMLEPGWYVTARQAFEHGGTVAKGKGQPVVWFSRLEADLRSGEEEAALALLEDFRDQAKPFRGKHGDGLAFTPDAGRTVYVCYEGLGKATKVVGALKSYQVWNVRDTDGLGAFVPEAEEGEGRRFDPIAAGERWIAAYMAGSGLKAFAHDGGNEAFYRPSEDGIHLPRRERFRSPNEYYSTAFHEMTHSTGHSSRLARKGVCGAHYFGSQAYSEEELVAEIGAAMAMGYLGISTEGTEANSAAYLAGWASRLRSDRALAERVVYAASDARKAFAYVAGFYEAAEATAPAKRAAIDMKTGRIYFIPLTSPTAPAPADQGVEPGKGTGEADKGTATDGEGETSDRGGFDAIAWAKSHGCGAESLAGRAPGAVIAQVIDFNAEGGAGISWRLYGDPGLKAFLGSVGVALRKGALGAELVYEGKPCAAAP